MIDVARQQDAGKEGSVRGREGVAYTHAAGSARAEATSSSNSLALFSLASPSSRSFLASAALTAMAPRVWTRLAGGAGLLPLASCLGVCCKVG